MRARNVAIITGSASGIGAATAVLLAQRGWNVVVNYSKSADGAAETARACEALGAEALQCRANVAEDADCRRMAAETIARWGRVDALVNSAGTTKFAAHADLDALSAEDFLHIYRVNTVGPYQMTRAVAPHMKAAGRGAVVNISSIAGLRGTGSSIAYAASKAALNAVTMSLARVLGPEIRVNAVCPGMTQGRWLRENLGAEKYEAQMRHWEQNTPLQRVATPAEVASAVMWFIEQADLVTGQVLVLDSGFTLGPVPRHAR